MDPHPEGLSNIFLITFCGPSYGGKTSLSKSITESTFKQIYNPTVGVDYWDKIIEQNGEKIQLQIMDQSGDDKQTINHSYFLKSCIAYIIVFDLTNEYSFYSLPYHLNLIKNKASSQSQRIYLFGNKSDLYENRKITFDQAEQFAITQGMQYYETSAKDFKGINEIMINIISQLAQYLPFFVEQLNEAIATPHQQEQQKQKSLAAPSNWELRTRQKIVLVGEKKSGKSSLFSRILNNKFSEKYDSTNCIDYGSRYLDVCDEQVKLMLFDTEGQGKFQKEFSCKSLHALVILYDITDRQQFNNVENWFQRLKNQDCLELPVFLIGNKTDLDLQREVTFDEGQMLAKQFDWRFYETSCKNGDNWQQIVYDLASNIFY